MARKMKDSGVAWIGEIPEGWEITSVKHTVSSVTDIDHFMPDSVEVGIPYLMIGDLRETSSSIDWNKSKKISIDDFQKLSAKSHPQTGDIIYARYASIGTTCYVDSTIDFLVSYACLTIRPNSLMSGKYLCYYLKSPSFAEDILRRTNSNTQGNVGKDSLLNSKIVLPPIFEQEKIAFFLDSECSRIDAMLTKTRASIEEYKKLKQAVITQAVTKGVRGKREMKDSGVEWIGEIPREWSPKRGKQLFIETNERSETGSEELLTVSHLTGVTPRSQKNVNMFTSESLVGYKVCHKGDLAANTMWMWQGAIGVSKFHGVISPSYNTYRQRNDNFHPEYLDYLLRIRPLVDTYNIYSTGVTLSRLRLYPQSFLSIYFIVPPMAEQQEIADYLDAKCTEIDKLIVKKEQLVKELEGYKKSLIYEVVTGKREVCV